MTWAPAIPLGRNWGSRGHGIWSMTALMFRPAASTMAELHCTTTRGVMARRWPRCAAPQLHRHGLVCAHTQRRPHRLLHHLTCPLHHTHLANAQQRRLWISHSQVPSTDPHTCTHTHMHTCTHARTHTHVCIHAVIHARCAIAAAVHASTFCVPGDCFIKLAADGGCQGYSADATAATRAGCESACQGVAVCGAYTWITSGTCWMHFSSWAECNTATSSCGNNNWGNLGTDNPPNWQEVESPSSSRMCYRKLCPSGNDAISSMKDELSLNLGISRDNIAITLTPGSAALTVSFTGAGVDGQSLAANLADQAAAGTLTLNSQHYYAATAAPSSPTPTPAPTPMPSLSPTPSPTPSPTGVPETVNGWVKGANGATCDATCSGQGKSCTNGQMSALTSWDKVRNAFAAAGYSCRGAHGARNYAGTPFSTARSDDCAPVSSGTVVCDSNTHATHAPLCCCVSSGQTASNVCPITATTLSSQSFVVVTVSAVVGTRASRFTFDGRDAGPI